MISAMKYIEEEIDLFRKDIKSLEILKNETIFREIANLDIHAKMDKKRCRELIEILKTDMRGIDWQYRKFKIFHGSEVTKELDYWRERAVCELAFLYILQKEYEEAVTLIKEEFERNRSLDEEPFSDLELIRIFFHRSERYLKDYEHSISWERKRLVMDMKLSTRDKNMEWLLRAAFVLGKCLGRLWKKNKKNFVDSGEITEEAMKGDSRLLRELMEEIENIEGKIV